MDELPSTERSPRHEAVDEQTGVGTPRSGDQPTSGDPSHAPDVSDAMVIGATTGSHPAEADGLAVNRSGSGGSGGADDGDADSEGSTGESMAEMLGGDAEAGER